MQYLKIPAFSVVALIGVSGSGKSTFARRHFKPTEVLSSDACRALVSDDENKQTATDDAFDVLYYIAGKRLKAGLLTVIDATNIQKEARQKIVQTARHYHALPVAIVLALPEQLCADRNEVRSDRNFGAHVIRQQAQQLKQSLRKLKDEGFRHVYILRSEEEVAAIAGITREKLYNDKREEKGPFDIIGDVHGCFEELHLLLTELGYLIEEVPETGENFGFAVTPPISRKAIFLGDLVDRGPDSPNVLRLVMSMVYGGSALCVPGNHDEKLLRWLRGKQVQINHGLEKTIAQLATTTPEFRKAVEKFLDSLISHYVLDDGNLVVAHAGLVEEMQGRGSGAVRAFCLYGETTGEIDEFGLPVRYAWAKNYRGHAKVVYGHTPVPEAEWLNRTIDIDTGCVFGGKLTALRYPEETLHAVPAREVYCEPVRPLVPVQNSLSLQHLDDDVLDIADVIGKRIVQTRLRHNITLREENAIAALEVMSRFAINPKWLIYLPPTMSPCATSDLPDFLEHPAQALQYYKKRGVQKVICEEKHMGSRSVIIVCKDEATAARRFGVTGEGIGVCYTRTGRNFFNDAELEKSFLQAVRDSLTATDFWTKLDTDWVCLDAELMPWSAKAQSLLKDQYAAVGAAAGHALPHVTAALQQTLARGVTAAAPLLAEFSAKEKAITRYIQAYRHYCWSVNGLADYRLAPFHILATEGQVHTDKSHEWHMTTIAAICEGNPQLLKATPYRLVDLQDPESEAQAIQWWLALTQAGGEGMVVKPYDFLAYEGNELLQPAVKCRGSEYLRIIYGPEYDTPENLARLKNRGLSRKQSLALREFALGIEALHRFVAREPLRRVHESVFGVLALESEEVDPRL